ncbi:MAG: hypothetical protein RDV41_04550 [Planctomycetota bacterium]|nr:hypothetical protein [Planctomycetota bacterium]
MNEDREKTVRGNTPAATGPAEAVLSEIREECRLFGEMVRTIRACKESFPTAEGPDLERLVAERGQHLSKIEREAARLSSLRERWARDIASAPPGARKELDAELDKLSAALKDILAAEEECARLGLARRDATVQRLRDMANTKRIDAVYKVKRADRSHFVDTNE